MMHSTSPGKALDQVAFVHSLVDTLPGDPLLLNRPRQVRNAVYTPVAPTPVAAPKLLAWSDEVGSALGLNRPLAGDPLAAAVLSGSQVLSSMRPYAARYGGHQFGHWAGQLGDGRAITLGELIGPSGQRFDLQLKGAGPTPYSRTADGRAVLRSSVREFLCSEAMHHLGVPTTRALSLVATGEPVVRDMFYDGRPRPEPGAVVCRVAPSFLRFGNYEILAANDERALLQRLVDYTLATHFPDLPAQAYGAWFAEVCRRTAVMTAHWQSVGFVHGVMNTDNMSILGLTIDYGPYGWLEDFNPEWTPNTTDAERRRYCYGNQPSVAFWNLQRLAAALEHGLLVPGLAEELAASLEVYRSTFDTTYRRMLAAKFGVGELTAADDLWIEECFTLMANAETDMAVFYRGLSHVMVDGQEQRPLLEAVERAFYRPEAVQPELRQAWAQWLQSYAARVYADGQEGVARLESMRRANPKYVLRNYLAQEAIEALEQKGDSAPLDRLAMVLKNPYDEQPEHDLLAAKRPDWARDKPGCSALSCSS